MSESRAGDAWAGQESGHDTGLLGGTEIGRMRARTFGEVADEYDRVRPGYPDALVDDVVAFAALGDERALEVGAGTGKATVAFASRGVAVTAVEPDAAMAGVLNERVSSWPAVSVVVSSFEDHVATEPYGLIFSAQAWHWTDPARRWECTAAALRPGGALGLFWNIDRVADDAVFEALRDLLQQHAPAIDFANNRIDESKLAETWPGPEIAGWPEFRDLSVRAYQRQRSLSGPDFIAYLSTQSPYRVLPETTREELFQRVLTVVGERIDLEVGSVLYLARRVG